MLNARLPAIVAASVIALAPNAAFAAWKGPVEVVSGTLGAQGQFFHMRADSYEAFPRKIAVDSTGHVVVSDEGRKRVLIFNRDGSIKREIKKPSELPPLDDEMLWPSIFTPHPTGRSFMASCMYSSSGGASSPTKNCVIGYDGALLAKTDFGEVTTVESGYAVRLPSGSYMFVSIDGNTTRLLKKPPSAHSVKTIRQGKGKTIIKFPDRTWTLQGRRACTRLTRDHDGNLYCWGVKTIERIANCGEDRTSTLTLPVTDESGVERGTPVVAPNGDAYAWLREKKKYTILRWSWADEPSAVIIPGPPTGVKATEAPEGARISWKPPLKDAGCVEGYEVSRAKRLKDDFEEIGKTGKREPYFIDKPVKPGATYHYKLRAMAGKEFSQYSAPAAFTKKEPKKETKKESVKDSLRKKK